MFVGGSSGVRLALEVRLRLVQDSFKSMLG